MIVRRQTLIAALAATTAEDTRYFLHSIRLEPEHNRAVATDAHVLLMIEDAHPELDADFPSIPGADFSQEPTPPFCLPADIAKAMIGTTPKKSTIPILSCIRAGRNGDPNKITVAAPDLTAPRVATIHDVGENAQRFPAYDRVIPRADRPEISVLLGVPVLEALIKAAKAINDDTKIPPVIRFSLPTSAGDREQIKIAAIEATPATETERAIEAQAARIEKGDVNSAVRITIKSHNGLTITGAAMPCRLT